MKVSQPQEILEKTNCLAKNVLKLLHSKSVLIDVGASRGELMFPIVQKIDRITIYAIEPDLIKFEQLKQNILQWEASSNNKIYALNIAMSDRDSQENFIRSKLPNNKWLFKSNLSQVKNEFKELSWEKIPVDIFKLDTLFQPIKPTLIKIDAGGDELKILQGSTAILKEGKTKFLIDLDSRYTTVSKDSQAQICQFMKAFNYTSKNLDGAILFVNELKQDKYKLFLKNVKKLINRIIPSNWRYRIKELVKK